MNQKNKISAFNEEIKKAISAKELKERTTNFLKFLDWNNRKSYCKSNTLKPNK